MIKPKFDNINRTRYYGLRVGDIVFLGIKSLHDVHPRKLAEVVGYGVFDNNRVYVKTEDGIETDYVAEWCEIVVNVEDRQQEPPTGTPEAMAEMLKRIPDKQVEFINYKCRKI